MKKFLSAFLIFALMVSPAWSATGWLKTKPASADNPSTISTSVGENNAALDLVLSNYREGRKITYNSAAQLTVTSGESIVSNSTGTVRLMLANSASTTVTWSDIDTGAEETSTTYYVYDIASATTDVTATCKISKSATAPSGVTYYKRLGSFYNDASGNITNIANDNFGPRSYDSGWFAFTSGQEYTKTHNLGTKKIVGIIYYANDTSDTAMRNICQFGSIAGTGYGAVFESFAPSSVGVQVGGNGVGYLDANGTANVSTSGYLRIVLISIE